MRTVFLVCLQLIPFFVFGQSGNRYHDALTNKSHRTWHAQYSTIEHFTKEGDNCKAAAFEFTLYDSNNVAIVCQCTQSGWKKDTFQFQIEYDGSHSNLKFINGPSYLENRISMSFIGEKLMIEYYPTSGLMFYIRSDD